MTCDCHICIYCDAVNPNGVRVDGLVVPSLDDEQGEKFIP